MKGIVPTLTPCHGCGAVVDVKILGDLLEPAPGHHRHDAMNPEVVVR